VSDAIMAFFHEASPLVEPISLDEAFIDLTGTERLWGDPVETGRRIKNRILAEQGLTASVGIGPNKLIAKLASDHQKPDGFVVVRPEAVADFLAPMPVGKLWGVGKRTEESLEKLGIRTIGDLGRFPPSVLEAEFGKSGTALHERALGMDDSHVETKREAKSVSRETTFEVDESDSEVLHDTLRMLAEDVAFRLRRDGILGRTACLKVRFSDFTTRVLRSTSHEPEGIDDLFTEAVRMYEGLRLDGEPIRLIGVGMTGLFEAGSGQLGLFDSGSDKKKRAVEAMDSIKLRHGKFLIRRGA
jgi:DNA polymerase IV